MIAIHYRTTDSPVGTLTLAGPGSTLRHLRMQDQTHAPDRADWVPDHRAFGDAVEQLQAYFAGELTSFDLDVELIGTAFERRVWAALQTIPYGDTRSYGEVAEQIGAPGASRGGAGQRTKSHWDRRALSSGNRRQRKSHRLRRRA